MITTSTRWKDCENNDFDKVINLLMSVPTDDTLNDTTGYINWNITKDFDENQVVKLNSRDIKYNVIKYKYDQVSPGEQPIEDRTVPKDGFIIPYHNGISVNYIINRNSDAQRVLRKLLNYSGKNEIEKNMFEINSDFFIWLISKVYNGDYTIQAFSEELHDVVLDSIKGFKGNTEDLLTKVSATGESVMNIISTLSFLLESKNLNQIKLNLSYNSNQNIELILNNKGSNGTIATTLEEYQGSLDDEQNMNLLLPNLYLLIYLEIIPILIQAYRNDVENDIWNSNVNIDFLSEVADELSEKVKKRIENLKSM